MATKIWNWGDFDNGHGPIVECPGEVHQPGITIDNRYGDDLNIRFDQLDPLIKHLKACKQFLYERGLDKPGGSGEVLKDADLAFELKPPTPPISYDEMRRLCGLPDVRGYVASRELARMGKQLGDVFQRVAEAWTEGVNKAMPGLQAFAESSKPKQAPPMWAVDPARSRRTRNRAADIRTPYR